MAFQGIKNLGRDLWNRTESSTDYLGMLGDKLTAMGKGFRSTHADDLIKDGIDPRSTEFKEAMKYRNGFDKSADFIKGTTRDERMAFQNATVQGFAAGAIGGGVSSIGTDQSFVEGAMTGGLMGAGLGGGVKASQLYSNRNPTQQIASSNSRIRQMRNSKNVLNANTVESPSLMDAKLKDVPDVLRKKFDAYKVNKLNANNNREIDAAISAEQAKVKKIQTNKNLASGPINPWATGGLATAGTLAYATLNSNQPIAY